MENSDLQHEVEKVLKLSPEKLAAQFVMPAIDLRPEGSNYQQDIEDFSDWPYYGYLIFGGHCQQIAQMTRTFRQFAEENENLRPIFACDLERGLGQIVSGGSLLPSLEAMQHSKTPELTTKKLAQAIGLEALAVGIDAPFAPVLDLSDLDENPIVGARSFHSDPEVVATLGSAFVSAFADLGLVSCGKHFPGHGGTIADSHDALPVVEYSLDQLKGRDLLPFRRAAQAGMSSVMTAHVAYSAISELPATLEPKLLKDLLRDDWQYDGLIVSDAFIMSGVLKACNDDEVAGAIMALKAGCDIVLYPKNAIAVAKGIASEIREHGVEWLRPSIERILRVKGALPTIPEMEKLDETQKQVRELVQTVISESAIYKACLPQVQQFKQQSNWNLVVVDDDASGQQAEIGFDLIAELQSAGKTLAVYSLTPDHWQFPNNLTLEQPTVVVIRCSIRAWKNRPGLHPNLMKTVQTLLDSPHSIVVALTGSKVLEPLQLKPEQRIQVFGQGPHCEQFAASVLLGSHT